MKAVLAMALLLGSVYLPCTAAEGEENNQAGCAENADDMAQRVKQLLNQRYVARANGEAMRPALAQVEQLLLEAGHCSTSARSHNTEVGNRQRNIMEWHSVNQWLNRLVGVLALNVGGDESADWRDEYELFAEVYEFSP